MKSLNRWIVGVAILARVPDGAEAQTAPIRHWTATGGAALSWISDANGTGVGPTMGIRRNLSPHVAVGTRLTVLLSSSGFYDFSGLVIDLGPTFTWTRGAVELSVAVGPAGLLGGDSDGSVAASLGLYVLAGAGYRLTPSLAVTVQAGPRVWTGGGGGLGGGAGLALSW